MPGTLSGDILTIRQLAEYLMVSEKTVYRMLDRSQLPGVRIGAQWRFRRQDIDAWLDDEVRRVEYEGQRAVLESLGPAELAIHPLLVPDNVWLGIDAQSRDELLSHMIFNAQLDDHVDREQLLRSIQDREALCSTALVDAAAFPHPLDPRPFRFSRKQVLLAVPREPLDWADPHGHHPRAIALILARSIQGHLLALSRAIKLFGETALIDRLASLRDPLEAIAAIADAESALPAPPEAS